MSPERAPNGEAQPIRPDEVIEFQKKQFPPEVVETFNSFIAEKLLDGRAVLRKEDVVKRLEVAGFNRSEVYDKGWLNIEAMYREAGWEVTYRSPGYDENFQAYFTFKAPRKN